MGYYDTEEAAARAYDRAAIGLLGRNHSAITTNFPMQEYDKEPVPQLIGKSREEVRLRLLSSATNRRGLHRSCTGLEVVTTFVVAECSMSARALILPRCVPPEAPVPLCGAISWLVAQVKATLKSERAKVPRRRFSSRQRTSRFMGVGSSNRKNQWQARILVHGKVCNSCLSSHSSSCRRLPHRLSPSLLARTALLICLVGQCAVLS